MSNRAAVPNHSIRSTVGAEASAVLLGSLPGAEGTFVLRGELRYHSRRSFAVADRIAQGRVESSPHVRSIDTSGAAGTARRVPASRLPALLERAARVPHRHVDAERG